MADLVSGVAGCRMSSNHPCRVCGTPLSRTFANLGTSPLANAFIHPDRADRMEPFYPLHAFVCDACFLVQLGQYETPEAVFGDYAYFSSYSESWLRHAADFAAKMVGRFGLGPASLVMEVASNDGYLRERGIPVLGVEPAANVERVAAKKGIRRRSHSSGPPPHDVCAMLVARRT